MSEERRCEGDVATQKVMLMKCVCVFSFQLLTVNPEHRFSSLSDMQTAPYLSDVNWDAVYEKKMEAGFVPNVSVKPSHTSLSLTHRLKHSFMLADHNEHFWQLNNARWHAASLRCTHLIFLLACQCIHVCCSLLMLRAVVHLRWMLLLCLFLIISRASRSHRKVACTATPPSSWRR